MSRPVVVDSSVILAALLGETHQTSLLDGAVVSAVNLAEVFTKVQEFNIDRNDMNQTLNLLHRVEPFTRAQALRTGELRAKTRALGLSLGDRACLALALELDADVYTADRAWSVLDLPCRIHLIR